MLVKTHYLSSFGYGRLKSVRHTCFTKNQFTSKRRPHCGYYIFPFLWAFREYNWDVSGTCQSRSVVAQTTQFHFILWTRKWNDEMAGCQGDQLTPYIVRVLSSLRSQHSYQAQRIWLLTWYTVRFTFLSYIWLLQSCMGRFVYSPRGHWQVWYQHSAGAVDTSCWNQLNTSIYDTNKRHNYKTPTPDINKWHNLKTPTPDTNKWHNLKTQTPDPINDTTLRHPVHDTNKWHFLNSQLRDANSWQQQLTSAQFTTSWHKLMTPEPHITSIHNFVTPTLTPTLHTTSTHNFVKTNPWHQHLTPTPQTTSTRLFTDSG